MHEIETARGCCGGVLVGQLLGLGVDAGLTGIDQAEKTFFDLRVDFGEDSIALLAGDLVTIDAEIESIPNFQKAQWRKKNGLRCALHFFPRLRGGSLRGEIKRDDESRVGVGQDS